MKMKNKIGSAVLAFIITAGSLTVSAEALSYKTAERAITHSDTLNERALTERPGATRWERYISLDSISSKNVWNYKRKTVKVGATTLAVQSVTINGKDYLPTRAVANALGLTYTYTSATRSVVISGKGLEMTFSDGCNVSYVNDRDRKSVV